MFRFHEVALGFLKQGHDRVLLTYYHLLFGPLTSSTSGVNLAVDPAQHAVDYSSPLILKVIGMAIGGFAAYHALRHKTGKSYGLLVLGLCIMALITYPQQFVAVVVKIWSAIWGT
jgi:uncharacterized membrane protein YoaK (UPF0700 family)